MPNFIITILLNLFLSIAVHIFDILTSPHMYLTQRISLTSSHIQANVDIRKIVVQFSCNQLHGIERVSIACN